VLPGLVSADGCDVESFAPTSRIFVAGHRGLAGSAIVRRLRAEGYEAILTAGRDALDLRNAAAVDQWFDVARPEYVFLAAARVGGILANDSYPVEFLQDNLRIQSNVIEAAWRRGVKKLLFLGSSCIYPKFAQQPIREDSLMTGPLEPTNEWYAVAKIAGIKLVQAYRKQYGFRGISLMPTNLYGPRDNFDLAGSHVLPALIAKFHHARIHGRPAVTVWGSGTPRREFLHADDLASAAVFLMRRYDSAEIINVGTGTDVTIAELAAIVARITGYEGRIEYDDSRPDGTPRKLLDVSRITSLGWEPRVALGEGIASVYRWYRESIATSPDPD
jgi:GDP-L-fucose synthase